MRRRVVITGMGAVTPIGVGVDAFWKSLLEGRNGVERISLFDASDYPCQIAAEVRDFDESRFFDKKEARKMARVTKFGVASALLCLDDACWHESPGDAEIGVAAGISNSARDVAENISDSVREHGYGHVLPYWLTKIFPHATASETGLATGFQSQVMTFATACTAGMNAIGYAADQILQGRAEAFLCPSTDATITGCTVACFCKAKLLSVRNDDPAHASRPFDAKRDGGVLGEGAGCVLVEELGHARRRGARVYAEIRGFGTSGVGYNCDPAHAIPRGMAAVLTQALAAANCGPNQIDYVGTHGVSDPHLDVWETEALKSVFGEGAYRIPMSSVKSMIGIPQNAAGVLQLIATVKALDEGIIPATTNLEYPDPACDLDYVPNRPRRNEIRNAVVLAHGFNGSDASIVVGRAVVH